MGKISCTDRVRCEVLQEEKEHKINRRKADWIGYIFRRNCLVKHVIAGKIEERIEVTVR